MPHELTPLLGPARLPTRQTGTGWTRGRGGTGPRGHAHTAHTHTGTRAHTAHRATAKCTGMHTHTQHHTERCARAQGHRHPTWGTRLRPRENPERKQREARQGREGQTDRQQGWPGREEETLRGDQTEQEPRQTQTAGEAAAWLQGPCGRRALELQGPPGRGLGGTRTHTRGRVLQGMHLPQRQGEPQGKQPCWAVRASARRKPSWGEMGVEKWHSLGTHVVRCWGTPLLPHQRACWALRDSCVCEPSLQTRAQLPGGKGGQGGASTKLPFKLGVTTLLPAAQPVPSRSFNP